MDSQDHLFYVHYIKAPWVGAMDLRHTGGPASNTPSPDPTTGPTTGPTADPATGPLDAQVPGLELESVHAGYRGVTTIGPIQATLSTGVHALLGRNGAGKTTLMRVMAGILRPLSGTVRVCGTDISHDPRAKDRVAYLGHRAAVSAELTVRHNLEFWAGLYCPQPAVREQRLAELRDTFDLSDLWERRAGRLSRGQLQRVDLARTLLPDPAVLLLDEPLTGLDPVTSALVRTLVRDLALTRTVLYSTHNLPEALTVASQILVLKDGTLRTHNDLIQESDAGYEIRYRGRWPTELVAGEALGDQLVRVTVQTGSTIGALVAALVERGVSVLDIRHATADTDASIRSLLEDQ
ncbi:ABC transporter ATP-binding protein [Kitasatospora sp. NBC_01266]|uniref:ABC transporter ATP-binding protein n=1 Tax=Kitasatospora sp. NBC_01266 TaxID=2903572 RepID=UPI002E32420A|nr:ABC transporter ATP-binding protein [Kitasatospora sp. NBC_01266]